MTRLHHLGDLQLAIMRVLWDKREASVAEVHAALEAERGLAPTTIATMLVKLEKKGVVSHRMSGRKFVYQPLVTEQQVRRSMVSEITRGLFGGDATALVSHLLSEHDIDPRELPELKKLVSPPEKVSQKKGNPR
jgi:BlaI family transcriptional regulator, penicillinase repressor